MIVTADTAGTALPLVSYIAYHTCACHGWVSISPPEEPSSKYATPQSARWGTFQLGTIYGQLSITSVFSAATATPLSI